ncbi:PilZ domain-containing protein [Roseibium marinum]|uniref:PilZ domain-containing protein n=1 Tax=Roseibium marinum TaxID=281252 RepID=A0A2S3V4R4_9HYPH|nr:PilZ domain-containing protein [Roseibium marinum]POF34773.1 PilZ domain-containing protein [Roseibium marinum]
MTGPDINIPERAVLHILVLDFDTLECEETSASGFSSRGCRVLTNAHKELGKTIGLRLAGFDQMIKGRVREILDSEILVSFEFANSTIVEKRRERRRKVAIPALVSGRGSQDGVRCEIVDASQSGCRLASRRLEKLPKNIQLQIPGLDMPVTGEIVWRSPEFAGVKLIWQFSNGQEFNQKRLRPPDLPEKTGMQEKRDASGFGVRRKSAPN